MESIAGFAEEIALKAGGIQLKGFRSSSTQISYKSRTDLVTNIDKESEEFLYNAIKEKFADHTIIAEEGSRREAAGEFVWYVDPLDATNNFAHGIPFFCVSLGVFSRAQNKVVAGVVYDPIHKEMFSAVRGKGASVNGQKIHVSQISDIGISVVATGFPYAKQDMAKNNSREFTAMLPNVQGVRRLGSAALDLCYVACGRMEGFWEPELKSWDMAAGSLLVEEAGGRVTKYNKEPFDPEYPRILASNGHIHEAMSNILTSIK